MSPQLISLSPDLRKLQAEGYEVSIETGHLLVRNVPYVKSDRTVARGTLVSTLSMSGNKTNRPDTHTIMFTGEFPCDQHGNAIEAIRNSELNAKIGKLQVRHRFSSKPKDGYADYYEKMSTYASILAGPAAFLQPGSTPQTFQIVEAEEESPFVYFDNASGRAGISEITAKLSGYSAAIVGLGGTGSYLLDLLAKTPVRSIHLFDDDSFEQHSAFRAPGAPSLESLQEKPKKVDYLGSIYAQMHKGIVKRDTKITNENAQSLKVFDVVFVCVDNPAARESIVSALEDSNVTFIDTGMGVDIVDGKLIATLRTTSSLPDARESARSRNRIPIGKNRKNDPYSSNIQVAELNALNACFAIIKWKKLIGFYHDAEEELFSLYVLDGNSLINEAG